MVVIEGTIGPILQDTGSAPVEGTNEVQNVEIGGTPDGGSFMLSWNGVAGAAIPWSATTNTMLASVRNALMGVASVQTITFAGMQATSKFRLSYRGQETAAITWSATSNTLRDNIDAALELLPNIGTAGVVTAVGTMTSGIGTITVTFAARGMQPLLGVRDLRLTEAVAGTEATITVEETTVGTDGPIGDSGVTVADVDLVAGIGNFSVTFDGENYGKQAVELMQVAANSLTGTVPTVEVTETTPGVTAFARGIQVGGEIVDTNSGTHYYNAGTAGAPDYKAVTAS
jgi:hypothetical protein